MTSEEISRSIAVIGMSCRFPGADTPSQFWELPANGKEAVRFFSVEELREQGVPEELLQDPAYVVASPLIEGVDLFDASFFGFTHREARYMDPQKRIFMECAWHALEDAGYTPEAADGGIGVYAGSRLSYYHGDPIEIAALNEAFHTGRPHGTDLPLVPRCAVGSVKTNMGHADAAAGIAGFIKTVLALYHGKIPPSLHFEPPRLFPVGPDPECSMRGPGSG